jgi:peroxiredoxin
MRPLGAVLPDFSLPDTVTGKTFSPTSFKDTPALLVIFMCRHCPYVVHVKDALARLGKDYLSRGVAIVGISANDAVNYPDDAPAGLAQAAREWGLTFPLLYDETQKTAQAFGAACTPDFFLYDAARRLAYRGQLDDSRPGNGKPVTGRDLHAALDAVLAGRPAPADQRPSMGCNIKWKKGNEPDYF